MGDEKTRLADAITHAEEVASAQCDTDCGVEHAQLALWLRELQGIKFPQPLPEPHNGSNVVSLDDHRIRVEAEFEDEQVAYVEALWGKETMAFNVAVRDLERMRRHQEHPSKPLRPPETYHEAVHMVLHVRALANDVARYFQMEEYVRVEDDAVLRGYHGTLGARDSEKDGGSAGSVEYPQGSGRSGTVDPSH